MHQLYASISYLNIHIRSTIRLASDLPTSPYKHNRNATKGQPKTMQSK